MDVTIALLNLCRPLLNLSRRTAFSVIRPRASALQHQGEGRVEG